MEPTFWHKIAHSKLPPHFEDGIICRASAISIIYLVSLYTWILFLGLSRTKLLKTLQKTGFKNSLICLSHMMDPNCQPAILKSNSVYMEIYLKEQSYSNLLQKTFFFFQWGEGYVQLLGLFVFVCSYIYCQAKPKSWRWKSGFN